MGAYGTQLLNLLMVEDAESDRFFFQIALENTNVNVLFRSVSDGQEGMEYILGRGVFQNRLDYPLPDIIVLDLRMRKVSGTDFLKWCQEMNQCRQTPIVVLTGAFAGDREVQSALASGAARAYLKPTHVTSLEGIVRDIYELGLKGKPGDGISRAAFVAA